MCFRSGRRRRFWRRFRCRRLYRRFRFGRFFDGCSVVIRRLSVVDLGRNVAQLFSRNALDDRARISIIVPARNEAHNLPALLASLRALTPPAHQIIIVDDHSTDGTGDLARAAGATVVTPPPLPPGWLGKPWACRAGAQAATGDLLLFSDSDTVHAPWSLTRAVARLQATGADLLSVIPTHAAVALWEKLQGVFHLLLLIACRAGGVRWAGCRS